MKSTSENPYKQFITRKQMSLEIGLDPKTFRKKLFYNDVKLPPGLISPLKVEEIKSKLGLNTNRNRFTDE
jgi:hypothetical protein